tara:strand:- start:4826 stop:5038 length:213 start_codon:yes stop_codon:yes gene_type:complete
MTQSNTKRNKKAKNNTVNKKEETSLAGFIKTVEENPKMVSHIPDAKDQMEALKKFEKGEMSYAQMRMMCG